MFLEFCGQHFLRWKRQRGRGEKRREEGRRRKRKEGEGRRRKRKEEEGQFMDASGHEDLDLSCVNECILRKRQKCKQC